MAGQIVVKRSGVGFFGLLTVAFVVLKLTGFIAWSWWLVFAPLWLPLAVSLGVVLLIALIALIAGIGGLVVAALEHRK